MNPALSCKLAYRAATLSVCRNMHERVICVRPNLTQLKSPHIPHPDKAALTLLQPHKHVLHCAPFLNAGTLTDLP